MDIVHFGWDKIKDGKKSDGTDVLQGGIKYYSTGNGDSEKLGFEKDTPVLEIIEEAKGTVQIGVRIYFETPEEYETFKADMLEQLK